MADFDSPEDKKPSRKEVYSLIGEIQKDGYITLRKHYPNNPKRTARGESYRVLASEFMSLRPRTMRGMFKKLLGSEGARKLVNRISKHRAKVNVEHYEGLGNDGDGVMYIPEVVRSGPVSKKYRPLFSNAKARRCAKARKTKKSARADAGKAGRYSLKGKAKKK